MVLSTIVLSFNRRNALAHTLEKLLAIPAAASGEIIVADNASTDGTVELVRERFPAVQLLALEKNVGVEAFNAAAERARGDVLLILDDDAWPEARALEAALGLLAEDATVGGVALSPVHPRTNEAEWRHGTSARGAWPFMGCGNVVRAADWRLVGGYEASFFLYRNDCDLALKLLGAGRDVRFDPSWVVWHDSPAATRKSERWLRLATRNWVWLAKRHGRGLSAWWGAFAGAAWAAKLAGWNPARWWRVVQGLAAGVFGRPRELPEAVKPDGKAYEEMIGTLMAGKRPPRS